MIELLLKTVRIANKATLDLCREGMRREKEAGVGAGAREEYTRGKTEELHGVGVISLFAQRFLLLLRRRALHKRGVDRRRRRRQEEEEVVVVAVVVVVEEEESSGMLAVMAQSLLQGDDSSSSIGDVGSDGPEPFARPSAGTTP